MRTTPIQGDDPSHRQLLRSEPPLCDGLAYAAIGLNNPNHNHATGLHCNGTSSTAPIPCDFPSRNTSIRREPTRCDNSLLYGSTQAYPERRAWPRRANTGLDATGSQHSVPCPSDMPLPNETLHPSPFRCDEPSMARTLLLHPARAAVTARNATCQNIPERLHQPSCHQAIPTRLSIPRLN